MHFYLEKFQRVLLLLGGRYFLFAGIAFLLCYVIFRKRFAAKKIQSNFPKNSDFVREIGFSFSSMLIFALIITPIYFSPSIRPISTIYTNISDLGWGYYVLAFPIMFFMHDTYFYWLHRWMHTPGMYKLVHLTHHKSMNPSPWAAYAFHPIEAILENGIAIVFYFTIPVHITHVPIFFVFSILYNIYGHLGWELYPKGFNTTLIGRWVNTAVSHNQHHKFVKGNYGLYFLFWDRWMGTIRTDYDAAFDQLKNRKV
jgi:sterol desaturase/sphingolipid hydroxylase (fatty acid hydroxylase superfamily)